MGSIVLIEDDPNSVRLATRLLEKAGHHVVAAFEGEQGLQLIAEHAPDVVLVDLGLPDMDGQTIIALLRQQSGEKSAAVVAFTAWPEETAYTMLEAYGCDGIIVKPINTRTFAEQVAGYIHSAANAEP